MVRTKNTARKSTTSFPNPKRPDSPRPPARVPEAPSSNNRGDQGQEGLVKKRYRPGYGSIQEIRRYQSCTEHLIPKLPFQRLVREIMMQLSLTNDLKIQSAALSALQVNERLLPLYYLLYVIGVLWLSSFT